MFDALGYFESVNAVLGGSAMTGFRNFNNSECRGVQNLLAASH